MKAKTPGTDWTIARRRIEVAAFLQAALILVFMMPIDRNRGYLRWTKSSGRATTTVIRSRARAVSAFGS
jgi:hypothetical protein